MSVPSAAGVDRAGVRGRGGAVPQHAAAHRLPQLHVLLPPGRRRAGQEAQHLLPHLGGRHRRTHRMVGPWSARLMERSH